MTKAEELKMLDATIRKFGQNSYIGPWLADSRGQIAADINNDFSVSAIMPGEAYRRGTEMMAATQAECQAKVEDARSQAARIMTEARKNADDVRRAAAQELERLAGRLAASIGR